ncbi:MAG: hypothetical protein LBG81_08895 [Coriobacteriaceae bacterium]|nr:hypothetical protein [Coriobacteriaceae bacterium]
MSKYYYPPSSVSAYGYWMVADASQPAGDLYFLLLPLLAAIPFSWSLLSERRSGYAAHLAARVGKTRYLVAKHAAAFIAGGTAAAVPLILNFVLCICFAPLLVPTVQAITMFGVYEDALWSIFFYNLPLLYCGLRTALVFLFAGLWASAVMALSGMVKSRIALLLLPYLFLVLLRMLEQSILYTLFELREALTPFFYLRTVPIGSQYTSAWVIALEFAVMGAFALAVLLVRRREDFL